MREMKDTGVVWIGEIPKGWELIRFRFVSKITTGNQDTQNSNPDGIYPFYVRSPIVERSDSYTFEGEGILMAGDGAGAGRVFHLADGKYAVHQRVYRFYDFKYINKYLLKYYLENMFSKVMDYGSAKTTVPSVRLPMIQDFMVCIPQDDEQTKIVNYLDKKCSQIDALIANAEHQITKLKAYKQSIITEAVTKGLNHDVPMKDSGIEWIGDIPEQWSAAPIRSLFRIKKDIIGHDPETVLSITQNGLKIKDISENSGQMANSYAHYQIVNVGDFAMNHMDLLTGGVGISEFEGVTSPDYRVFVMRNKELNPRFFLYVFQMYYRNKIFYAFGQGAANLGRWRLPAQNFNTVAIPLAPVEEQNAIVAFLDKKCDQIDQLIALKQQKIEKLQQYKKSIIYEYVTGKKEV